LKKILHGLRPFKSAFRNQIEGLRMITYRVESREKYALIAIPQLLVRIDISGELQVEPDLWVNTTFPFNLADHWKEWIGSIATSELEMAQLFLLTKGPSAEPETLDGDNRKYQLRIYKFYQGLMLSGFLRCDGQPLLLTGASQKGNIDVREYRGLPNPHYIPGSPIDNIDIGRLNLVAKLASAIDIIPRKGKYDRFNHVFSIFFAGIESEAADESLHHFVRCIEGFIFPEPGKTRKRFLSRTELFIGPGHHQLLGELFDIRSSVEHLHSSIRDINGSTDREKWLTLFERAYEAGAIARYCIRTFLLNPGLWKHFEDDNALNLFWSLPDKDRRKLWGDPLDIQAITKQFDPSGIRDDELAS